MSILKELMEAVPPQQPQQGQQQAQPQAQPAAQPQQSQPQAQQPRQRRQGPAPIVQGVATDPYSQILAYINANPDKAQAVLNYILKVRPNAGA